MAKCWTSHVIWGMLYWKWKTMAVWVKNACVNKCIACLPSGSLAWLEELGLRAAAQHHKRVYTVLHIITLRKYQNSEFEIWFPLDAYYLHTCTRAQLLQLCLTLCDPTTVAHRLLCLRDSPGMNTGVVGMPSFRESPQSGDSALNYCISCITGRFYTHWDTWETHLIPSHHWKVKF